MKTIFNNLFWAILLSWIVFSGTAYTNSKCGDAGSRQCCSASALSSKIDTFISSCSNTSQCAMLFFYTPKKDGCCCEKQEDASQRLFFFNIQNPNFHITSFHCVFSGQRYLNNKPLRSVFEQYKTRQSISIYTLVQSFLC